MTILRICIPVYSRERTSSLTILQWQNELPFSERSLSIVKDILIVEKTPDYTIRAKTGFVGFDGMVKPEIGWYVGYLEKGNNTYFFATNIDIQNPKDVANRIELTRRCFQDLGLL